MTPQLTLKLSQLLRYSSDSFVEHEGVRSIVKAVEKLATQRRFSMLYIEGERSSGKTHLGVYLAGRIQDLGRSVRFVAADELGAWFLEELPKDPLRAGEVVIVDDADLFLSRQGDSRVFGNLVEQLQSRKGIFIMLGASSLQGLAGNGKNPPGLDAALSVALAVPEEAMVDGLLAAIAKQRGLKLSESKRSYVLRRIPHTLPAIVEYADRLEGPRDGEVLSTSLTTLAKTASASKAPRKTSRDKVKK
jgi:chromosomal replication initiation ATPase DnaA